MFIKRLINEVNRKKTALIVGLDPDLRHFPTFLLEEFGLSEHYRRFDHQLEQKHRNPLTQPIHTQNPSIRPSIRPSIHPYSHLSGTQEPATQSIYTRKSSIQEAPLHKDTAPKASTQHNSSLPRTFELRQSLAHCLEKYMQAVIDVVAEDVAVVKFQTACYERLGGLGMTVLENLLRYARKYDLMTLLDGKRGDVPNTATIYAETYLAEDAPLNSDAITVQPYLGMDALEPFFKMAHINHKGVFVCVKTSNSGSHDFQDLLVTKADIEKTSATMLNSVASSTYTSDSTYNSDLPHIKAIPLYEYVAKALNDYTETLEEQRSLETYKGYQSIGIVAGATHPEEGERLRQCFPRACFLVPGLGAQGGDASKLGAFLGTAAGDYFSGALFNVSRGILTPYQTTQALSEGTDSQKVPMSKPASKEAWEEMIGSQTRYYKEILQQRLTPKPEPAKTLKILKVTSEPAKSPKPSKVTPEPA